MKSMILSMLTALALSDSVTNVIHENIPRLIENKRRLQINECSPEERASVGICKSVGLRYNPETDSEVPAYGMRYCDYEDVGSGGYTVYAYDDQCNGEVISSSIEDNDPCCSQPPHTTTRPPMPTGYEPPYYGYESPEPTGYCSPEERDSIGICVSIGLTWNADTGEELPAYGKRFCNKDGSGGYTLSAYDKKCNGEVITSSIEENDPCCSQPPHTTTTPRCVSISHIPDSWCEANCVNGAGAWAPACDPHTKRIHRRCHCETATTTPAATTSTTEFIYTMPPEPTGYCSPEERDSVGKCVSMGLRYNPETDSQVSAYGKRFCHKDGSGGYTISAYDKKCNGEVITSSIELNDPCCSQPPHTTTTPATTSSTTEFTTSTTPWWPPHTTTTPAATTSTTESIYTMPPEPTGYCSPEERASVGICEAIGLEYNPETDSKVPAYGMRFCDYEDAYGSGGYTVYAYDDQCSDNNPTILRSYIESNDPCCLPIQRCERELDVCFYGFNGFSSKLSCDASGLKYTLWMGGDCSYDTQIGSVHIVDPLCCPQFGEYGEY